MRVKALQKMYYNRRDVLPGEEYDMDDREAVTANLLHALGKIEILKPKVGAQIVPARTVQPVAAPVEEPKPAPAPMTTEGTGDALTGGRRQYRRRDLKAEQ